MDVGLLIIVAILGALLGLFSRQVLKSVEKPSDKQQPSENAQEPALQAQETETSSNQPHPHAI